MKPEEILNFVFTKNKISDLILDQVAGRSQWNYVKERTKKDITLDIIEDVKGNVWKAYLAQTSISTVMLNIFYYCRENQETILEEIRMSKPRFSSNDPELDREVAEKNFRAMCKKGKW